MGSPLRNAKAAQDKFKEAKKVARSSSRKVGEAAKGHTGKARAQLEQVAEALAEGELMEVKIQGFEYSLGTPEAIQAFTDDVRNGKFK